MYYYIRVSLVVYDGLDDVRCVVSFEGWSAQGRDGMMYNEGMMGRLSGASNCEANGRLRGAVAE